MKKFFSLSLFLTLLSAYSFAQSMSYQRTIDLGGDDYANMSIEGDSGTHYFVGSTTAPGGGSYDAFIAKLDAAGHFLWEKQYGGSGTEYGTFLMRTSDNNLLLVGRSNSFSSSQDIFVVKTDLSGNIIWSKAIGTDSTEYGLRAAEGPNGYLIIGQTKGSIHSVRTDITLINLDTDGNIKWSKSFGSEFGSEVGYDVMSIGEDGWVFAGYTGINNIGLNDGLFGIIDTTGSLQASFEVGGTGDDDIRRIISGDDAVYMVGNTRSFNVGGGQDVFVAKYNVAGGPPTLDWFKTYGGDGTESVTGAEATPDGQIVITALSTSYPGAENGLVMVLDSSGNVGMAKVVGSTGSDILMNIEISDNVVLVGYSNSFNGGGDNDIYYVGPDDNIGLGCHSYDTTVTVVTQTASTLGPVIVDFAVDSFVVNEVSPTNLTFSNTAVDTNLCDTVHVGVKEVEGISLFRLFPNPTQQNIHITFYNPTTAVVNYTILNLYGAVVFSTAKEVQSGDVNEDFNVNNLSTGTYFMKVQTGTNTVAKRFVILK